MSTAKSMTRETVAEKVYNGDALPVDGQLRKQYLAEVKQLEPGASNRVRQFCVSTGTVDRDNDTIDQAGWHLDNFRKNPVVLWAHDYSSLPVGKCTEIKVEGGRLVATAEFANHPMAETVLNLIDGGYMRATSVGFRPLKATPSVDRDFGIDFQECELLEFSIVPVPANPEALIMASKGIDLNPLKEWAAKTLETVTGKKGHWQPEDKGVSPRDVSMVKADPSTSWSAPSLHDLAGDKQWGDLSANEKRKIAGHFAWAKNMPPDAFGDLKLPHHDPDGKVVWRGVAAAAARMNQANIPSADMGAVKAHLARHYKQFGQTPPWEGKSTGDPLPQIIPDEIDPSGQGTGADGDVPPAGQADPSDMLCPACGSEYDGDMCPGCGWRAPTSDPDDSDEEHPMNAPYRAALDLLAKLDGTNLTDEDFVALAEVAMHLQTLTIKGGKELKRGRILSQANEARIRAAKDHLVGVLQQLDMDPDPTGGDTSTDSAKQTDDDVVMTLVEEPAQAADEVILQLEDDRATNTDFQEFLLATVADTVKSMGSIIQEQVTDALARARGRVD